MHTTDLYMHVYTIIHIVGLIGKSLTSSYILVAHGMLQNFIRFDLIWSSLHRHAACINWDIQVGLENDELISWNLHVLSDLNSLKSTNQKNMSVPPITMQTDKQLFLGSGWNLLLLGFMFKIVVLVRILESKLWPDWWLGDPSQTHWLMKFNH